MLPDHHINLIHEAALRILDRIGVKFHNQDALTIFDKAGAKTDSQTGHVQIPEELVTYALEQAPSEFGLYDRDLKTRYVWGDAELKLGSGGSVINILDRDGKTIRPPKTADLINMYTLTDQLEEVSWTAPGSFVADVPQAIAAIWRFYIRLKYGSKPSCADGLTVNDLKDNCDLLQVVRYQGDDYTEKPFAMVQPCPTSPLTWTPAGAGYLLESARRKLPALILAMPFAGVSAPITMAGTIAQQTAEILSGLVLLQLIEPGLPTVYGGGSSHADMRDVSNVMGSIQDQMMNAATLKMGHFYNLPTGTAAIFGYSDSKRVDYQAGAESALGQLILALNGADVVYGLGVLAGMDCNSLEKIVLDHELFQSVKRYRAGLDISAETLAIEVIAGAVADNDYLSSEHTYHWFQREYQSPIVFNNQPREIWESQGAVSCQARARDLVQAVLEQAVLNRLPPDQDRDLDRLMSDKLKRRGFKLDQFLSLLPE